MGQLQTSPGEEDPRRRRTPLTQRELRMARHWTGLSCRGDTTAAMCGSASAVIGTASGGCEGVVRKGWATTLFKSRQKDGRHLSLAHPGALLPPGLIAPHDPNRLAEG
jgi:hypothetical protein